MVGGIIKGMVETARNFFGSYTQEDRLTTIQYPEEKTPPQENARYFPLLVFDGADPEAGLRCVACKICEKECPPQCIYIVTQRDEKGKPMKHPKVFNIDISVCMSCQICAEVCPFDAIKMDTEFEWSRGERFQSLLLRKEHLAKSNEYFHKIHATEAAEVDARLNEAKAKAAAKKKAAETASPPPSKSEASNTPVSPPLGPPQ